MHDSRSIENDVHAWISATWAKWQVTGLVCVVSWDTQTQGANIQEDGSTSCFLSLRQRILGTIVSEHTGASRQGVEDTEL